MAMEIFILQKTNFMMNYCESWFQGTDSSVTSDEESNGNRRSVRFVESSQTTRDTCDGAVDKPQVELPNLSEDLKPKGTCKNAHDTTEMTLTFKLGTHLLIPNNSLKPNSAVRQLFPCSKPPNNHDVVTNDSLRSFDETKKSKVIIQGDEADESIKKAIERNTLRRSLIR